jgi:cell envelope opacity-associated protein A
LFVDPPKTVLVFALRMGADQTSAISKLKAGQKATIKGVSDGRAKMMAMAVDQVSLKECVVQ